MTISQPSLAVQYEDLDETIKDLLETVANELARETGFMQRKTALDGSVFARTCIFGWLANADASYSFLQQVMSLCGCQATAQALEQRMSEKAADFLLWLLYAFLNACVASEPVMGEVFEPFPGGIVLQDGTIISLPGELEGLYRGCGGSKETSGRSGVRVQVRLNLSTGELQGPWLQSAAQCERKGAGSWQQSPLPADCLYVTDSAYIPIQTMKDFRLAGQAWLSSARTDARITDASGVSRSMSEFLQRHKGQGVIDEWVLVGGQKGRQERVRLIAFEVSAQTVKLREEQQDRHSKARAKGVRSDVLVGQKRATMKKTKRHRHRVSKSRQATKEWTIIFTNVPVERLSALQARVILRSRWQIELLWKLWKERGKVDTWRSEKTMRILCELYAKLMGLMIQHWITLTGCWTQPHRSLVKACGAVQLLIGAYALSCSGPITSAQVLMGMGQAMHGSRIDSRRERVSTSRLLQDPQRLLSGRAKEESKLIHS